MLSIKVLGTYTTYDNLGCIRSLLTALSATFGLSELKKVWILVDLPFGKKAIRTKWVYRNKKDRKECFIVRNKARLVAQGHRQEEGIDYDEVFALVARIEAIRIFLAFASYMRFIVYQMDVKSAFLYGIIDEKFYVSQPLGFIDPKFPKKVYNIVKALYGLHQAPRAWYATLSTFLVKSRYRGGTIDKIMFVKKDKKDIMLVKQKEDGIFISQDKYVAEILKKFDFMSVKTASTPIETQKPLVKDEEAADVDVHLYRSMIGSLMYLTASRPDIMFAVCACSRFQVTPKTSHLHAMKRIFRYLKGKPKLGLWYPRVSAFDLEAYSDSDYARANLDKKSTTGGCQFLGRRLISWQCKKQTIMATSTTEAEYVAAANCCGQVLKIHTDDNVADLLTKAFDVSRKGQKFSGRVTPLFPSMLVQNQAPEGEGSGTHTEPQPTPSFTQPSVQLPNDSPHSSGNTFERAKGGLNLQDLHNSCTLLSQQVLDLQKHKDVQAAEILKLKTRIKKLEKKCKPSISHHRAWLRSVSSLSRKKKLGKKEFVSKQGRKNAKPGLTLDDSTFDDLDLAHGMDYIETKEAVNEGRTSSKTKELNVTNDTVIIEEKGSSEKGGSTKDPVSTDVPKDSTAPPTPITVFEDEDIFLADVLVMLSDKTKLKGVEIKEMKDTDRPARSVLTLKPLPTIDPKNKGKGILEEEPKPVNVKSKGQDKAQMAMDEKVARQLDERLQAELERERVAEEEATNAALIREYDEIQARINAYSIVAARLQEEEREKFIVEERAKFLHDTIAAQRKFLTEQKAAAIRNKPPTKYQLRSQMMTYLRHKKSVQDFIPIGSAEDKRRIEEMSKKATGKDTSKKQKVLKEPDGTKVEVKQDGAEESTRKTPCTILKIKARKKARKQTHADTDDDHNFEEDERKI
ncbi:putative ribonuclease H-like domain-containing protein [Tanacetum coccineum]